MKRKALEKKVLKLKPKRAFRSLKWQKRIAELKKEKETKIINNENNR